MPKQEGYWDCCLVVEGGIQDEQIFHSQDALDIWAKRAIASAKRDGYSVEVYAIRHDHAETEEECACVQYLTDHHPYMSYKGRHNGQA